MGKKKSSKTKKANWQSSQKKKVKKQPPSMKSSGGRNAKPAVQDVLHKENALFEGVEFLNYKLRGDASAQGRPRVYFCCHKNDFDSLFEPVTDEILDIQHNAAIWYRDPSKPFPEDEQFLNDLSQMQLFVIPVTSDFLYTDDPARTVEMEFALKNHIPVLPLLQDPALSADFSRICGDLQYLDRNAAAYDSTALPYEEKLQKYLESVLVSDEQAARIRKAFDAYIFLSYRKKDRAEAQKIMRLIHSNDFCRDLAIWYDEFLTPGENFNDEIKAAMEKSSLFTLVVTPHLLEDPNYILTTEYPAAVAMHKDKLPIESQDTDAEILQKMYNGIGECYPTNDPPKIAERLHELLVDIALQENADNPEHNFLIGLAYLAGIDVEVDHERAVRLITGAAEQDLPEAYEKLVSMYRTGEGVERSYYTAIEWQKKYVDYLQKKAKENNSPITYSILFNKIYQLGDYQQESEQIPEAKETYKRMLDCALTLDSLVPNLTTRALTISYVKLSDICDLGNEPGEAAEWGEKGLDRARKLAGETGKIEERLDLAVACNKLGQICEKDNDPDKALLYYTEAKTTSEKLARETGIPEVRRELGRSYCNMGDICLQKNDLKNAKKWYEKAIKIRRKLAEETGAIRENEDLALSYLRQGHVCMDEDDPKGAIVWYEKEMNIREDLAERMGTAGAKRILSTSIKRLIEACEFAEDPDGAEMWREKLNKL